MKNIILAVSGLSPQVITETLYALHQNNRNIDEIHVITTKEGKDKIYTDLFGNEDGYYYQYLNEYGINKSSIKFGHQNIHAIKNKNGVEINDIENEDDNEKLLKKCLELAFYFTMPPNTAVFFSIAGGRKTMSACLTLAAQIYGRPQDRLYHILVSPEFESNRNFYYPPVKSKKIELRDRQHQPFYKETQYARINIIHIPFISVRNQLPQDLLNAPIEPANLILSLIKDDKASLIVNLISGKIIYRTIELDMMPARMALYVFFAMQKKHCQKETKFCGNCDDCFLDINSIYEKQKEISNFYKKLSKSRPIEEMSTDGITNLSQQNFNGYKSRINKEIQQKFGSNAIKELEISSVGQRPNTRYGISIDKNRIEIVL
ncbi:MAG: TIGR02584 family CRISPR-associated protein [Desulfobacterales bacterium]|nr:TIGR02584 family CRISPR-associated protein [Desulfobacterales bacterium]